MKLAKMLKSLLGVLALCLFCAGVQAAGGIGPYYAVPSWDQTLPASTRFVVLTNLNNEAVLDRETGLVWQKSPNTSTFMTSPSADAGHAICNSNKTGGRQGWRLPGVQELASLTDPSVPAPGPTLPAGHPFVGVQTDTYYLAATIQNFGGSKDPYGVDFESSIVAGINVAAIPIHVWCVRGGQGPDIQ